LVLTHQGIDIDIDWSIAESEFRERERERKNKVQKEKERVNDRQNADKERCKRKETSNGQSKWNRHWPFDIQYLSIKVSILISIGR
jgi:hypothetical protein